MPSTGHEMSAKRSADAGLQEPAGAPVRRVLVTGLGAVTPLGDGVDAVMRRWMAGQCAIEDGQARCQEFDPRQILSRRDIRRTDRFAQFALAASGEALAAAGWNAGIPYEPSRVGCVIGTAFGGIGTVAEYISPPAGDTAPSAALIPMLLANAATAAVAIGWGLKGPSFPVGSSCAAGADAIAVAARMIQVGAADAMVAGAAEAPFVRLVVDGLRSMRAISQQGVSRPFDCRRDGFVLGEGSAIVVLEERELALARNAQARGELLGVGMSNDAYHITTPRPDGTGFECAMTGALSEAAVAPRDLDYINAHGTSTPLNDRVETIGLKRALGACAGSIPISSTKSAIGHLLGAAGAIDVVVTIEALRRALAPPTLGLEEADPELDLDYVPGAPRSLPRRETVAGTRLVGLSNAAGFGGHATAICLAA
jgi:3-oxoacyl-[acyl-carrier-protein] synthase II